MRLLYRDAMTEVEGVCVFKNRDNPARLQCFNYRAGDARGGCGGAPPHPLTGTMAGSAQGGGLDVNCVLISVVYHSESRAVAVCYTSAVGGAAFINAHLWPYRSRF